MPSGEPRQKLVVIGASAGGVEVLRRVVASFAPDLPAAVCIVLHISPESPSALAQILARSGALPCRTAEDGDRLIAGTISVAPPDRHLVVEDGRVRLTTGPRENGHRPAIDVLFRSAAAAFDGDVVGVVLSGSRDDGSAGLAQIKESGGSAVVQEPAEALYASMPANAIESTAVDVVAPSSRIADAVDGLVRQESVSPAWGPAGDDPPSASDDRGLTTICPECGGLLSQISEAGVPRWVCRVGHRYSEESLLAASAASIEATLWAAIRALQDRTVLLELVASRMEAEGEMVAAVELRQRAGAAAEQVDQLRGTLAAAAESSLDTTGDIPAYRVRRQMTE